jgi:hypothetical protein
MLGGPVALCWCVRSSCGCPTCSERSRRVLAGCANVGSLLRDIQAPQPIAPSAHLTPTARCHPEPSVPIHKVATKLPGLSSRAQPRLWRTAVRGLLLRSNCQLSPHAFIPRPPNPAPSTPAGTGSDRLAPASRTSAAATPVPVRRARSCALGPRWHATERLLQSTSRPRA